MASLAAPPVITGLTNDYNFYFFQTADGNTIKLPRATKVLNVLEAPGLTRWKLRQVAQEIAKDENLAAVALSKVDDAIAEAMDRHEGAAAKGTEIHSATEDWEAGADRATIKAKYSQEVLAYLNQYILAVRGFQIESVFVEKTTFNFAVGYAGTFDRIVRLPSYEGTLILDIKSGKGVYDDHVLQQAAYANAEGFYDPDLGPQSMPADLRRDIALILHLASDHYELIPVELEAAWPAYQATVHTWQWKKDGRASILAKLNPDGTKGDVL